MGFQVLFWRQKYISCSFLWIPLVRVGQASSTTLVCGSTIRLIPIPKRALKDLPLVRLRERHPFSRSSRASSRVGLYGIIYVFLQKRESNSVSLSPLCVLPLQITNKDFGNQVRSHACLQERAIHHTEVVCFYVCVRRSGL